MAFIAHNIRLIDGTETYPAAGYLLEEAGRFQAAKRMLNLVFPEGLSGKRIADLGCLEGGYATGFARLGMNATGIEIRDSNFRNCLYVKSKVNLPSLTFIQDDVNNIDKHGTFDAIWACGIFYHLENPRSFMERAARACEKMILLETHFTYADRTPAAEFYKLSEGERFELVRTAVRFAGGRIQVMAQSNHPSPRLAAELACRNEGLGAGIISFALPRQFAYPEETLLRYAEQVAGAVRVRVLVQDFNPGGPSVGASFAKRLKEAAPNFCFLKLEEPAMGPKIRAIRKATGGAVGVLEGWGGMYMIELAQDGVAGVMPGLAMCDLFVRVFERIESGDLHGAASIHRSMLPQIGLALQSMEVFHHCEKRLLAARGLMQSVVVRDPAVEIDEHLAAHIDLVNRLVLEEVERNGLTSRM